MLYRLMNLRALRPYYSNYNNSKQEFFRQPDLSAISGSNSTSLNNFWVENNSANN